MKIRKFLYISVAALMSMATFSCGDLEENERLIEAPLQAEDIVRNVLVEDFTGQECVNCPTAHEIVEQLQEQYGGEHIVAVSIHGGGMAIHENDFPYGLANDLGEEYNRYWEVKEWPKGMVDRSPLLAHTAWTAKILDDFVKFTPIEIAIETKFDDSSRNLTIDVKTNSSQDIEGKLQVWITEDNIQAMQFMPNGSRNRNYIHNNVLRTAANGAWGTDYSVARNGSTHDTFNVAVSEDWDEANLAIVAFVYDRNGVLQVVRQPINAANEDLQ